MPELGLLLSKNFLKIVSIAAMIGLPLVWWVMNNWLDNFTYRVAVSVPVMLIAFIVLLGIIILTIGLKVLVTAKSNPVDELRYE